MPHLDSNRRREEGTKIEMGGSGLGYSISLERMENRQPTENGD